MGTAPAAPSVSPRAVRPRALALCVDAFCLSRRHPLSTVHGIAATNVARTERSQAPATPTSAPPWLLPTLLIPHLTPPTYSLNPQPPSPHPSTQPCLLPCCSRRVLQIMAAIAECTKNPMAIFNYQNDPEASLGRSRCLAATWRDLADSWHGPEPAWPHDARARDRRRQPGCPRPPPACLAEHGPRRRACQAVTCAAPGRSLGVLPQPQS